MTYEEFMLKLKNLYRYGAISDDVYSSNAKKTNLSEKEYEYLYRSIIRGC